MLKRKFSAVVAAFCLMFSTLPVFAADPALWLCDGKFGLCRYVDRMTGHDIIPARFEEGMPFSEGLAAVRIGGRFGYIDERGELVIEPRFDLAARFAGGLAEVVIENKAGVINRKGEIVVPPMFRRAIPLTSEVIIAAEGSCCGSEMFEWRAGDVVFGVKNAGLYHIAGHWLRRPDLRDAQAFNREGRGLLWARERDGDIYGLLASNGEWVVRPEYEYGAQLTDGRAIVRKRVDNVVLSGAVDLTGQLVVPLLPRALFYWHNGWGLARNQEGKWALVDRDGNVIGGRYFDQVERADQGDIAKVLIDGRWAGIDRAGNILPNPDASSAKRPDQAAFLHRSGPLDCGHGLRLVARDGLWGIVGADGMGVIAPRYRALDCFKNGTAWAAIDSSRQWCVLGPDGAVRSKPVCVPHHYPYLLTHSSPEVFDNDPYENSVLWLRAYLEFSAGQRDQPPRWISRPR